MTLIEVVGGGEPTTCNDVYHFQNHCVEESETENDVGDDVDDKTNIVVELPKDVPATDRPFTPFNCLVCSLLKQLA